MTMPYTHNVTPDLIRGPAFPGATLKGSGTPDQARGDG